MGWGEGKMFGIKENTFWQKSFISLCVIGFIIIAYWLMSAKWDWHGISLFLALMITATRMGLMLFGWLSRGISWKESVGILSAFALYFLGFPVLYYIQNTSPRMGLLFVGWLIFLLGSLINTYAELQRKRFKAHPQNKGKLYTGGLFNYAVHINYFGDCIWVLGLTLISNNLYGLGIPLFLVFFFKLHYIPIHDRYLTEKYGEAFKQFKAEKADLIPYLW